MSASMEARIGEHVAAPIPPTNPAYDQAPLGHRATMIGMRDDIPEEDMPPQRRFVLAAPPPGCDVVESSAAATARAPRGQYGFVDTVEAGQSLICSPGHDGQTIARAADRAEDVGYARALQASEHRMMTSIEEVNLLRVSFYNGQVRGRRVRISHTAFWMLMDLNAETLDAEIDIVRTPETLTSQSLHEWFAALSGGMVMVRENVLQPFLGCFKNLALMCTSALLMRPDKGWTSNHREELQKNTYHGWIDEDVVNHIAKELEMVGLIRVPGVDSHQLRMKVFPLSLTNDAWEWRKKGGEGKITIWEELVEKFFGKFYPESYDREEEMLDKKEKWGIDPLEFISRVNSSFDKHLKIDGRTKKVLFHAWMNGN
ncbi:hypothetical protein Tco_0738787 [Tanacetum coccineum]